MNRKSKVSIMVLFFVVLVAMFTSISSGAVSQEEIQKIENAAPEKATVTPKQPRKLLVFNLCKGYRHGSIPYWDKALEIMGSKTGAYKTVISNDMDVFKAESLAQFDAVCLNNTTKLKFGPALQKSLMDFIKEGCGIVGIHAATDNFYDWPEAAKMMGGQFCGHPWGSGGTWAVKIDEPDHTLMAAFKGKGFKIKDEIYRTAPPLYSREKQLVLMSLDMSDQTTRNAKGVEPDDMDTGISWIKNYGKGRLFYGSLGHNNHITWNPAILRHYLDGIQFALGDLPIDITAGSKNQLDVLLRKIAAYEYGQSRADLIEITNLIRESDNKQQFEEPMPAFLQSDATPAAKQFICRKLSIIGTQRSVTTLAKMLLDGQTSDMARYALERIPGTAVDEALRQALLKTTGKTKVGIINSLGQRRDGKSVAVLKSLIYNSDMPTATAAVVALGKIADPGAVESLSEAKDKTSGELRQSILYAYLECADELAEQGQKKQAFEINKQLYSSDARTPIRIAALRGMVATTSQNPANIIVKVIKSGDETMLTTAFRLVGKMSEIQGLGTLATEMPNLSTTQQVQLLSALGERGDLVVLPEVVNATKSTEVTVRIAALKALGQMPSVSSVDLLARTAAETKGAERDAARESLYSVRGLPQKVAIEAGGITVDQVILKSIPRAESKVKVELIRSIGRRNIEAGVETLLKTAKDPDRNVRVESLKVLRNIAGPKHVPALVKLLVTVESETELREAERTVASASRNAVSESTDVVLTTLASVKDVKARCSLLRVLGKIGASKALGVLREALKDNNAEVQAAAIRALSDRPTAELMTDLLNVVQTSDNKIHRALALRGYVRLIGLDSDRPAEETIEMCRQAMALASNVSEKKMVLSGLANIRSFAALEMAADYLEDSALQQEAGAAIVKIADATVDSHLEQTRLLLWKVIEISKSDSLREWAQEIIDEIE